MTHADQIRRRIRAKVRAISADADSAIDVCQQGGYASDELADLLSKIEDRIADIRDEIGNLLTARAEATKAEATKGGAQ